MSTPFLPNEISHIVNCCPVGSRSFATTRPNATLQILPRLGENGHHLLFLHRVCVKCHWRVSAI